MKQALPLGYNSLFIIPQQDHVKRSNPCGLKIRSEK